MNIFKQFWLSWRYRKRIPNAETIKAMEECEDGDGVTYNDIDDFFLDLNS